MNKARMIWGIVCISLAIILPILDSAIPGFELVFMIEGTNMPYVPLVILGVVGVILISTSRKKTDKQKEESQTVDADEAKISLNKRFETIGWGCFLIMLGGFMFIPDSAIEKGFWSIGIGAIFLGLNVARYLNKIRMSGFTTFLGIISVISGIAQLSGVQALEGPSVLIILGAYLIFKSWFDKRQLFGKAEES